MRHIVSRKLDFYAAMNEHKMLYIDCQPLVAAKSHSAEGTVKFILPIVGRCSSTFSLFWLRGDETFADSATIITRVIP